MIRKILLTSIPIFLSLNLLYSLGLQLIFHLYNNGTISLTNISLSDFYYSPEIYNISQYFNISQIPREKIWTLELTLKNGSVLYKADIYSEMFFWIFVDGPNITSNIVVTNETYAIFYVPFDKDLKKVTIRDWNGKVLFERDISNDVLRLISENCPECLEIINQTVNQTVQTNITSNNVTNVTGNRTEEKKNNLIPIIGIVVLVLLILMILLVMTRRRSK